MLALVATLGTLLAQGPSESQVLGKLGQNTIAVLVYTTIGLAFFALAFFIMVKVCPFSVKKEIEEDQNISLAIIMGSVILGIAIIVAAAVHG